MNGYLEFYRKTRNIRRAPLMVYSGGLLPDIKFARCSPAELDLVPISGFEIKVEGRVVEVIFKFIKIDSGSWVSLQNLNTVNLCFTVRMLWDQ